MRVRAKSPVAGSEMYGAGYYAHRLFKGGEEFELSDPKHFSERWMEKVVSLDVVSLDHGVQFVDIEVEKVEPSGSKKKR